MEKERTCVCRAGLGVRWVNLRPRYAFEGSRVEYDVLRVVEDPEFPQWHCSATTTTLVVRLDQG
jgi:hypothetical protein